MKADKTVRTLCCHSAFTLIELLAVMVLMILIMTASVVSWNGIKRGAEMRAAINDIQTSVALARQYAVLKNADIVVAITNKQVYYITNMAGGGLLRGGVFELPLGVQFAPSMSLPFYIRFRPNGGLADNATVTVVLEDLKNTNHVKWVRVNGLTGVLNYE